MDPEEIYIRIWFNIPTDDLALKDLTVSLEEVLQMLKDYESNRITTDNR